MYSGSENMVRIRKIEKVWKSRPTIEGAGIHLKRAFGFPHVPQLDPFLLLDDFRSHHPAEYINGFPWHPHRGIETITYMLDGLVEHGDSMGNKGIIRAGEVQWMTAGSGIIHQEMPKGGQGGVMGGFQLWANLPASHKMMEPRYREVTSEQIPEVTLEGGARARVIAGTIHGTTGPVRDIVIDPTYCDVSVPGGGRLHLDVFPRHTTFAYVREGSGFFDDRRNPYAFEVETPRWFETERTIQIGAEHLVLYGDGGAIDVEAGKKGVRFLLVSGKPIREPVAWYGPIVMNTQEELRIAFEEYRNGTFIKSGKVTV